MLISFQRHWGWASEKGIGREGKRGRGREREYGRGRGERRGSEWKGVDRNEKFLFQALGKSMKRSDYI